jgi:DNA modification methylase
MKKKPNPASDVPVGNCSLDHAKSDAVMSDTMPIGIKPYYDEAGITIYHGDCLDILPLLPPVDCVVTDPPYGIEGGKGGTSKARGKGNYSSDFPDTPEYIKNVVVKALFEIAKWRTLAVTPGCKNISLYPPADSFGAFVYPASSGMQRFGMADCNPILFYGWHYLQGKKPLPCCKITNESPEKNGHPCPKPTQAWAWLVDKVATKDMTVLDPFMGSGTTLRVCKDRGIRAVGIEMNERYCEIAVRRLAQEVLPL